MFSCTEKGEFRRSFLERRGHDKKSFEYTRMATYTLDYILKNAKTKIQKQPFDKVA